MKKLLAVLLVLVLTLSMVACGDKTTEAEAAVEEAVESVEDAAGDVAADVETAVEDAETAIEDAVTGEDEPVAEGTLDLPELEGLTKMDMNGMTVYTNETGTTAIGVFTAPSNEVVAEGITSKNEEALAELVEQQKASYPGAEAEGEFVEINGNNVYKLSLSIPANPEMNIPVDSEAIVYMIVLEDSLYLISAADTSGGDVSAVAKQAEEVIAAL